MQNINPNEKTSQSQNAKILAHLQNGGRIKDLRDRSSILWSVRNEI